MKAKQRFETALELAARSGQGNGGARLDRSGKWATCPRPFACTRARRRQPTDVGYLLLARALQLEGRVDEANAISERVARSSPDLPEAQKTTEPLLSGK